MTNSSPPAGARRPRRRAPLLTAAALAAAALSSTALATACGRRAPSSAQSAASVSTAGTAGTARDGLPAAALRESAEVQRDVERVRRATAAYRELDSAVAAGYPHDVPRCIANEPHGAMGFHHMRRDLSDAKVELERPEILLYSRTADGGHQLNGVEYIVPYTVHPRNATPPTVMGQALKQSDQLLIWYLHVWVWTDNPSGLFADWNPAVKC